MGRGRRCRSRHSLGKGAEVGLGRMPGGLGDRTAYRLRSPRPSSTCSNHRGAFHRLHPWFERPDPAGGFSQSCPLWIWGQSGGGRGGGGKPVPAPSFCLPDQLAGPAANPGPTLPKVLGGDPFPKSFLRLGLGTQKALGPSLGGAQGPGGSSSWPLEVAESGGSELWLLPPAYVPYCPCPGLWGPPPHV